MSEEVNTENKSHTFLKELNTIKDDSIREFTIRMLNELPDYFYEVPASSSGKYHPSYALGDGGLVRHTKAAVGIANMLFTIYDFSEHDCDIIRASLIMHDGLKSGYVQKRWTQFDHPIQMSTFIGARVKPEDDIFEDSELIRGCIESHMGQWNTRNGVVMPLPETEMQKMVHLCDYLASRKSIEFNFEV